MAKRALTVVGSKTVRAGDEPPDLGEAGSACWAFIQAEYCIEDSGGITMLTEICRAVSRGEELRHRIDQDGLIIETKNGPREHPLIKAELANRAFITRTLQRLGLNVEPVRAGPGRPGFFDARR
jgi:hypothetical protein